MVGSSISDLCTCTNKYEQSRYYLHFRVNVWILQWCSQITAQSQSRRIVGTSILCYNSIVACSIDRNVTWCIFAIQLKYNHTNSFSSKFHICILIKWNAKSNVCRSPQKGIWRVWTLEIGSFHMCMREFAWCCGDVLYLLLIYYTCILYTE